MEGNSFPGEVMLIENPQTARVCFPDPSLFRHFLGYLEEAFVLLSPGFQVESAYLKDFFTLYSLFYILKLSGYKTILSLVL